MGTYDSTNLISLVKDCRKGDKRAWEILVRRITPLIFSICHEVELSRDERYDVLGQVLLLLLEHLDNVKSADKLLSYVGTMTRREIYARHRRSLYFRNARDAMIEQMYQAHPGTPDEIFEQTRTTEGIMQAMALLPKRDYELLYAIFFDPAQPSYEEISARLGIGVPTIGSARGRALRKLHTIMKKKKFFD